MDAWRHARWTWRCCPCDDDMRTVMSTLDSRGLATIKLVIVGAYGVQILNIDFLN